MKSVKKIVVVSLFLMLAGCQAMTARTICLEHGQLLDTYQQRGQMEIVKCVK